MKSETLKFLNRARQTDAKTWPKRLTAWSLAHAAALNASCMPMNATSSSTMIDRSKRTAPMVSCGISRRSSFTGGSVIDMMTSKITTVIPLGRQSRLNERIMTELQLDGRVYISNALLGERFVLRACIVNHRTEADDIDAVLDLLTSDASLTMPPEPYEYQGWAVIARFLHHRASLRGAPLRLAPPEPTPSPPSAATAPAPSHRSHGPTG